VTITLFPVVKRITTDRTFGEMTTPTSVAERATGAASCCVGDAGD
jgi:hypothetical protein